jgi:hypothetical protein
MSNLFCSHSDTFDQELRTFKATVEITLERRCVIGQRYRDRTTPQLNSLVKLDADAAG